MENQNNHSGLHQVFGVISLILGILGFIFSFIPCFGAMAIYPSLAGLCCGIIAAVIASKTKAALGLATAGIMISLLGSGISYWQIRKIQEADQVIHDAFIKN